MLKVFIINAWMKDYEIGTYCRFVSFEVDTTQPHKYIYKYFITNKYYYH